MYQRVFQLENIGLGKPSQDECHVFAKYKTHCKNLDGYHDVDACGQCKVGNAKLAEIIRKRLIKLVLITAKTGIKMQITLEYLVLICRKSSFFPK